MRIILFLCFIYLGCGNLKEKNAVSDAVAAQVPTSNEVKDLNEKFISSSLVWVKNLGLCQVESVIFDAKHQVFYASNGKDYKPGHDGFISSISLNGEMQELKWVDSLNRPTGMAIYQQSLYVADVNRLVVINTNTGEIISMIEESLKNSGLNDVAVSRGGEIFVTGSLVNAIFRLEDNHLQLWVRDDEKLIWANGLVCQGERILLAGLHLATIDMEIKKTSLIELTPKMEDFDGISYDGEEGYFLTTVNDHRIWYLNNKYQVRRLIQEESYYGDLEFIPTLNKLFVARGNHKIDEYFISVYNLG